MNKSDLASVLSKELNLRLVKAEDIVNTLFDVMSRTLASGQRIEIRGFGTFSVREYGGYKGRNPKSGKAIAVKSKKLPFFKVGKDFKDRLNKD